MSMWLRMQNSGCRGIITSNWSDENLDAKKLIIKTRSLVIDMMVIRNILETCACYINIYKTYYYLLMLNLR